MYDDYTEAFKIEFEEKIKNYDAIDEQNLAENEALIYLGGGVGFPTKSLVTQKTLISPKVFKCTEYQGKCYEMGLCKIKLEEKKI